MKYLLITTNDLDGVASIIAAKWWASYCCEELEVITENKYKYKTRIESILNKIENEKNESETNRMKEVEEIILTRNPGQATLDRLGKFKFGHKVNILKMFTTDPVMMPPAKKMMNHFLWAIPFGDGHGHVRRSTNDITSEMGVVPNIMRMIMLLSNYNNKSVKDRSDIIKYHLSDIKDNKTIPMLLIAPAMYYICGQNAEWTGSTIFETIHENRMLYNASDKSLSRYKMIEYQKKIEGVHNKLTLIRNTINKGVTNIVIELNEFSWDLIDMISDKFKSDIEEKNIMFTFISTEDAFNVYGYNTTVFKGQGNTIKDYFRSKYINDSGNDDYRPFSIYSDIIVCDIGSKSYHEFVKSDCKIIL